MNQICTKPISVGSGPCNQYHHINLFDKITLQKLKNQVIFNIKDTFFNKPKAHYKVTVIEIKR